MGHTRWQDLPHKSSPERQAQIDQEAREELDRVGYADLRKACSLTQVELAGRLGISQASVAGIESRTDLQLSTLAKYISALGGKLEIRAVFPQATFHLEPQFPPDPPPSIAASTRTHTFKRAIAKAS